MLNLKDDADSIQKEIDKMGKAKGTSVVKASTSDVDFDNLIQQHMSKIKTLKK